MHSANPIDLKAWVAEHWDLTKTLMTQVLQEALETEMPELLWASPYERQQGR